MQKQLSFLFGSFSFIILIFIVLSVIDDQGDFFPSQNDGQNDEEQDDQQTLNEEEFFQALDNTIGFVYSETEASGGFYIKVDEPEEKTSKISVDYINEFYNYEEIHGKTDFIQYSGSEYKNTERFDFFMELDYEDGEILYEEYETLENEFFSNFETIGTIQHRFPGEPLEVFKEYLYQEVDFEDIEFSHFEVEGKNHISGIFSESQGFEFFLGEEDYFLQFENFTYEVRFNFQDSEFFFEFYDLIDFEQKNIN